MILLVIALILPISAKWQQNPNIGIMKIESQPIENIELSLNEVKSLSYSDVVGFKLFQKQGIDDFSNIDSFKQINNTLDSLNQGCTFQHRAVSLNAKLQLKLPLIANTYFNDMVIFEEFQRAYLVRNDLKIFKILFSGGVEGYINYLQEFIYFDDFSNYIKKSDQKYFKPLMCRVDKIVYIFTHLGGVRFEGNNYEIKEYNQLEFIPFSLNHTDQIKQVLYNPKLKQIYILMKQQIAVYSVALINPKFQYFIYLSNTELLSIRLHEKEQILFILTKNKINLININENDYNVQEFTIPMENSVQFNYLPNTFIVIAQTPQQISFAVEILWDQLKNDYYYNKFYLQDMKLIDVYFKDQIGFLIGGEAHSIIFPNGFRENTDQNSDFPLYTEEILFANLQKIDLSNLNNSYRNVFALSQNIFETFSIEEKPAAILCSSENEIQQSYWAFWNITSCVQSPFEVCQIQQKIILKTYKPLINSDDELEALIIFIVVGTIILIFFIVAICVYKKWNNIIQALESQKQKRQYADIQEIQDAKEK